MDLLISLCAGVIAGVLIVVAALGLYIFAPRPEGWWL